MDPVRNIKQNFNKELDLQWRISNGVDPVSRRFIKKLLSKRSLRPLKKLGQHFLIDKKVLQRIIRAANLKPEDIVLEIGPGIGTLTLELVKKVKKVLAVEKDSRMVEILKETLKSFGNIKIIQGDILKINLVSKLKLKNYKIVANIPYYLTSPLIRNFLEEKNQPKEMILMVQKEVAQRICAKPPDMNLLAVSVQFYSQPEIIAFVPKKSFWPSPKVDSAIIKIVPYKSATISINSCLFFKIVKAGFSQPRKQILNNLTKWLALSIPKGLKLNKEEVKLWLQKNKILPEQRAETLTIKNWKNLAKSFYPV